MRMQKKPIYEISSKSNNGKVVKYTVENFLGGNLGGEFWDKNENLQNGVAK